MEEKNIQPNESLAIINSMIDTAKNKIADDGFLFIFWGWNVLIASMIQYLTVKFDIPHGYLAWAILMPLGGIVSAVYGRNQRKKEKVRTYVDEYLGYNWSAFVIALFLTLIMANLNGWKESYFFIMMLYGIATYISGGLLRFRPLVIGSVFSFAFAVISVFAGEIDQLLCLSGALVCSYLIPGYMLRSKFRSQENV
jgi:hypothetical protein